MTPTEALEQAVARRGRPALVTADRRGLAQQLELYRPTWLVLWLEHSSDVVPPQKLISWLRERGPRPQRIVLAYQPVEKCHRGIFQHRQVRSEAPHGSQNNDLRRSTQRLSTGRYFDIASMRCRSLLSKSTGCCRLEPNSTAAFRAAGAQTYLPMSSNIGGAGPTRRRVPANRLARSPGTFPKLSRAP